jgi:hypothetical protein
VRRRRPHTVRHDDRRDGRNHAYTDRPWSLPSLLARKAAGRGDHRIRGVHREHYAQVNNADPFAPCGVAVSGAAHLEWMAWLVQLIGLDRLSLIRHPLLDVAAGVLAVSWCRTGWRGVIATVTSTAGVLGMCASCGQAGPSAWSRSRCGAWWRWWYCRRRWRTVMTIAGLAPAYRGQVTLRMLGKVQAGPLCGPGGGVAGLRPVAAAISRPRRGAGPRVGCALVPGPHRPAWHCGAGA